MAVLAKRRRRDVFALWGAAGEVEQPHGGVCGVSGRAPGAAAGTGAGRTGSAHASGAINHGRAPYLARWEGGMTERQMQSDEPDGDLVWFLAVMLLVSAAAVGGLLWLVLG